MAEDPDSIFYKYLNEQKEAEKDVLKQNHERSLSITEVHLTNQVMNQI